jgi:site-specific DNA recombinase
VFRLWRAEQGHWPTVAHLGYVNNRETRRIDIDPVRGPVATRAFELYATGDYSLSALRTKARELGLTHRHGLAAAAA